LSFDLNETLINWRYKYFVPSNGNWKLISSRIEKLKSLKKNCLLVIFTNQCYRNYNKIKIINFLSEILSELRSQGLDFIMLAAIEKDEFKKPSPKMYEFLLEEHPEIKELPLIFIGDAAGREKDFSDSDKRFAENINAEFLTPEEFFQESKL
jgi:bifunctional polynucleotide phosphatase/kinase